MSEPPNANQDAAHPKMPDTTAQESSTFSNLLNKPTANENNLSIPLHDAFSRPSSTFSEISNTSTDTDQNSRGRLLAHAPYETDRYLSKSPAPLVADVSRPRWRSKLKAIWIRNKGLALVMLAQFFGVMMSVTTRLLEMDGAHGKGMHPFQILFARMAGTIILSGVYQWFAKVEHAPFGPREVWPLLLARGFGGFFGVFGMYYSLAYLPLADATVITFLAPIVACWACSILLHEPFTRSEQFAGLVSLLGVVLIARPTSLVVHSDQGPPGSGGPDGLPSTTNTTSLEKPDLQGLNHVTPSERLGAVGVALVGVLGAACAYTTIRWIGRRAHPLISVNYFAAFSMAISTIALLALPGIGFRLPASLTQWAYLVFLGVCGFVMQFLLTAGLAYEKSSRATNMVYTQMLFALAFDKLVWGVSPGVVSIVGSSLILGSALWVAVLKNKVKDERKTSPEAREEEETGLMAYEGDYNDDVLNDERGPLRGVQEVQLRTLRV